MKENFPRRNELPRMPRSNAYVLIAALALYLLCWTQITPVSTARNLGAVLEIIEQRGLHAPTQQELFSAAVSAMAESHDQHSGYIPPATSDRYLRVLDQQLSGIGISVRKDTESDQLRVQSAIIGQPHPAYDAGMRSGDLILRVSGEPVQGKLLRDVTRLIQGEEGTEVEIVVSRGEGEHKDEIPLRVPRATIRVDSVLGAYRNKDTEWNYLLPEDEKIAFFQITDFGDLTAEELRNAIMEITQQEPPEAMIIDLRDNSGGYLSAAVDVSDLFLSEGNIVTTRGRGGTVRETFDAKAEDTWSEIPMVLLINGDTASASEIFAACMQDHQRASILGERSFGKGSVQQMIPLPNGGLLKLTTASYHRPSGENIHRRPTMVEEEQWGVKPDKRVQMSPDDAQRKRRYETRAAQIASPVDAENPANRAAYDADPLLKEAVKMLKRQIEPSDDKN